MTSTLPTSAASSATWADFSFQLSYFSFSPVSDTPSTPNGKIARLPAILREAVNRRLHDGEPGPALLAWLNSTPEAQEVCKKQFDGEPISPQNLSAWRNGGFQKWLTEQASIARTRDRAAYSRQLAEASGGNLAEGALAQLTGEVMDLVEELSLMREAGAEGGEEDEGKAGIDPKLLTAAAKALVAARAKELETRTLLLNEKRHEQNERALKLDEARFNLRFAETFLDKLEDLEARAIATSNKPRETKIADLVKHWFGEMPEGIGPQAATVPAAA